MLDRSQWYGMCTYSVLSTDCISAMERICKGKRPTDGPMDGPLDGQMMEWKNKSLKLYMVSASAVPKAPIKSHGFLELMGQRCGKIEG